MSSYIVLATCAPYLPGYGFRAELQTDGTRYRLVSFDCSIPGETRWHPPTGDYGDPVVRAECVVSDVRHDGEDHELAEMLCSFWTAYVERPEEFERDPESLEQVNRDWWTRNGDHMTGQEDDGSPIGWTLPGDEEEPAPSALSALAPESVTWIDRALSTEGTFNPAAGYVLCELDGETYAVSGRYCGLPDDDGVAELVADLHLERFMHDEIESIGHPASLAAWTPSVTIIERVEATEE